MSGSVGAASQVGRRSSDELLVCLALKLKGFATAEVLEQMTGLTGDAVSENLDRLSAVGSVGHRDGRVGGWHLTKEGRPRLEQLLEVDRAAADLAGLERAYAAFLPLNGDLKALCTRWQQEPDQAAVVADYASELTRFDREVGDLTDDASTTLHRFARYRPRFAEARGRFAGGDLGALTRPLSNSFHDVWMELHQDLLSTLGRERSEADGH